MEGHGITWVSELPFNEPFLSLLRSDKIPSVLRLGEHDNVFHVYHAILVVSILTIFILICGRRPKELIPEGRASIRNFMEVMVEGVLKLIENTMGHEGRRFLPLIGTLAIFILFCNLLGLVPGFLPPTDNINTTAACALTVFFFYHYIGIRKHGWKYVKQFTGSFWPIAPLMFPIEIISHLARPLSLSLRLFGNITGDHLVLVIFSGLIPLIVPICALGLGIFVSFIQSLVFILLSMMYISGALAEEH
jgi:F-type H+-transporting ATPase subunit a